MVVHLTLGLKAFVDRVEAFAKERGIAQARVAWKRNARGELVIAIIIPPSYPGEWDDDPVPPREQLKAQREKRRHGTGYGTTRRAR
jgi:hypothetical protein